MSNTWIVSGLGSSASDNGGGHTDNYVGDFLDLHSTGGPVSNVTTGTVTEPVAGTTRVTSAGNFTNSQVGMIANIIFPVTTAENDRYEITARTDDYIEFLLSPTDSTCDCKVGGFFSNLDQPIDESLVAAGDIVYGTVGSVFTLAAKTDAAGIKTKTTPDPQESPDSTEQAAHNKPIPN